VYQHNAPVHAVRHVTECFDTHENEVEHLPWTAQSPDLNIYEPLWSILKEQKSENVILHQHHMVTWPLFWKRNGFKIPLATVQDLYLSFQRWTNAVLAIKPRCFSFIAHPLYRWMCVLLTQIYIYFILFYFFFPGKYLLPYASTQQAWSATGSETTNLVRMRSQTLGKSAPSLTASLVSIPQTNRVQPVIMWWIPCSNTRERHCIIGTK